MKTMKRLICWIAGHRWKHVGEHFVGFEKLPRHAIWKCQRCRVERETHPWMRPAP